MVGENVPRQRVVGILLGCVWANNHLLLLLFVSMFLNLRNFDTQCNFESRSCCDSIGRLLLLLLLQKEEEGCSY